MHHSCMAGQWQKVSEPQWGQSWADWNGMSMWKQVMPEIRCSVYTRSLLPHSLPCNRLPPCGKHLLLLTCTCFCCPAGGSRAEEWEHSGQSSKREARRVHSSVRNQEEREGHRLHLLNERKFNPELVFVYIYCPFGQYFEIETYSVRMICRKRKHTTDPSQNTTAYFQISTFAACLNISRIWLTIAEKFGAFILQTWKHCSAHIVNNSQSSH